MHYHVVRMYSDYGDLDNKEVRKLTQYTEHADHFAFDTKEALTDFTQKLANETGCMGVHLLAVNDFNIGMESCHNISDFKEIFIKYGTLIESDSSFKKSKGILGRFF